LAEWFQTYQEWISRWQRYVRQGGLEKLKGEHEGWVLTPEMGCAILEIWVPFSPLRRFHQGLLMKSTLKAGSNVSTSVPATFARV